jgi:Arc/MetJ-type ribon-helix-helix transcriptional regulator
MNIQITQPELEAIINQRLQSGAFKDAEDVILQALQSSPTPAQPAAPPAPTAKPKNLVELFAPLRGQFTDEEVDTLFSRNRSTARPLDLT